MPRIFKKKFEFFLVLAAIALVAVWSSDYLKSGPLPYPESIKEWDVLSKKAGEALHLGKPEKALRYLNQAELLALEMPAGDQRLSETYDDMGHAYFRLERHEEAKEFQGKAVASRLLTGGPEAKDLNLFIERYQLLAKTNAPPYEFVGLHPPYRGDRWNKELANLIYRYEVAGDKPAVEYLSQLKG
jgi:tetratricopeptide (TPR) repeat protein